MSSDEKVLDFPRVEVTSEENAGRVMVEATRLASLAPGEWRLWIDRSAERLRLPRATLQGLIAAIIKDSEKKPTGTSVNREAQIASMLIVAFAVAFVGWALVQLASAPIYKDDQRPTASRLRRWLLAAFDRSQKGRQ